MTLLTQIKADQLAARKAKDGEKASLLTTLIGEIDTELKRSGKVDELAIVKKFLKGVNENLVIAGDRRDSDWCDRLDKEKEILEAYQPKQLTKEEIDSYLTQAVLHDGLEKNKGAIMKYLKDNFAGKYDGKMAASIVDEFLKG